MVEYIDSYMLEKYREVTPQADARINTETPAWAIDRLSILALKIYHMHCETVRTDVDDDHRAACRKKLEVLQTQQVDLSQAIEELFDDIASGTQVHEGLQTDEDVQRPVAEPRALCQK